MQALFPAVAFVLCFVAARISLGKGLVALFAVGYVNGAVRANFLGTFTTFTFDTAILGLYSGFFLSGRGTRRDLAGQGGQWLLALVGWPILLTALPMNDLLIQLVALRATVWFLPLIFLATRFTGDDLIELSRGLAVLNLVAFAGGVYVYLRGVESLYPVNAITQIIYNSRDVTGGNHRVPSTFLSAHAYGGTMVATLPFLFNRLLGPKVNAGERGLYLAGVAAAVAGLLMCAARQPVVVFAVTTLVAWLCTRCDRRVGFLVLAVVVGGVLFAGTSERLQRAATLEDTDAVSERIRGSANETFFELLFQYPLGAGMGTSAGTSIPYFLTDRAPVAIGMENEYCRILVDQGWPGLILWLVFLFWLLARPGRVSLQSRWGIGVAFMYAQCVTAWATAFIGTGLLASVPGSALLLIQMGVLVRVRCRVPGAVRKRAIEKSSVPSSSASPLPAS